MERPVSIVWFERCYLGVIALGVVNTALQWPQMVAQASANPSTEQLGPNFVPTVLLATIALTVVVQLLLWFFAARKRAVVAKWIVAIFFVIGLLGLGFTALRHMFPAGLAGVLTIAVYVLDGIAVWNLFRPDAEAWFAGAGTALHGASAR